jgi:hypothetical protein
MTKKLCLYVYWYQVISVYFVIEQITYVTVFKHANLNSDQFVNELGTRPSKCPMYFGAKSITFLHARSLGTESVFRRTGKELLKAQLGKLSLISTDPIA